MSSSVYQIRKSFLIPVGLVVLLSCLLLLTALVLNLPLAKVLILTAFLLPAAVIFAESWRRQVTLTSNGIEVSKLFRRKSLNYSDLTAVETIQVRKRVFVSLSSDDDFLILSNSYAGFERLLQELLARVPEETISDECRQIATAPPTKFSDIFAAWLAVAVLTLIIIVQLRGGF